MPKLCETVKNAGILCVSHIRLSSLTVHVIATLSCPVLSTAVAVNFYDSRSLRSNFHNWRDHHQRAVEVAQFTDLVQERGKQAKLRRLLTHWVHCIQITFSNHCHRMYGIVEASSIICGDVHTRVQYRIAG